jgi:hypothetical protein
VNRGGRSGWLARPIASQPVRRASRRPLSTARIHQHTLLVSQASLERAVTAFPSLLNFLRRIGFRGWLNDGRGVFSRRGKISDERFQNCRLGWIGEICSIEDRAQAGLDSFGFLSSLFRSRLPAAQSFPKGRNGLVSCPAANLERRSYLAFESLVVSIENSGEVPIGAVGRGILKNESAALAPWRYRKGDFASRTIRQRVSNRHFLDALVPKRRAGPAPAARTRSQLVEQCGRQIAFRKRGNDDHDGLARHGGALADLERGGDGGA